MIGESLLPPDLRGNLAQVIVRSGNAKLLEKIIEQFADLSPASVAQADGAIAACAGLYRGSPYEAESSTRLPVSKGCRIFGRSNEPVQSLQRTENLEFLYIFHRDGRLREAALRKISGSLPNAFLFAAVAWRLNDWVKEVRDAAEQCALRCFPQTPAKVIAAAAEHLLIRKHSWRRWQGQQGVLDMAFNRPDVVTRIASVLSSRRTGRQAMVLRCAMRSSNFDPYLEPLSIAAIQPSVRAAASAILINGEATWPEGSQWKWVDKPMGIRRKETVFERRPLTVAVPILPIIENGLDDRSAHVRRVALSGLIRHFAGTDLAKAHAQRLQADRSASVRERARFLLRQ